MYLKELAEAVKNPSEALEKQKEKASEVKEGLKDAYGEGQVNAAVKANTTSEKENQEGAAIPSAKDHQDELHSNENSIGEKDSKKGQHGQLPKIDPEQYRYKSNINSENEKRISDLPKRNQEVQTDDDSIDLPNDNGIEVGTEKSTKVGLPKAENLPTKDSRLNQFKENDQEIQDPKQQFKAATDFILKNEDKTERVENLHFETEKYKDHLVDYQPLTEKGRNYLKEERKLPDWLIDYAEKEGLIAELKPKHERQNFLVRDDRLDHAVAFLWKDPQTKETVGASYQGTFIDYERFGERGTYKHIDKNSTANHGFNLKIGDPKQLKFFESSIDLLSYAALNRDQLNDTWLVSMEGLKHHVISHYFGEAVSELRKKQAFPQSIEICVDNDRAGHIFYEKEQLMGAVDPFTNQKVRCERGIANDWQVPREYKVIYEEVAKEEKVTTEAIMAIHKTENNLQLTNQLVSAHKVNASFGQQLSFNDSIEVISLKDICREVAKELKDCELSNGTYDFDRFYQGKGDINSQILFSYKAEQYYKGYKNHEHEFVPEVKKDWNDQLKHEIQQQEIRKQKRAMLFQQGRQQERE